MTRFALRGILGRKLRTALTAISIVLGVAMVTGSFVLTDSIRDAFTAIFNSTYANTDAVVTGKSAFDLNNDGTTDPSFDESLFPTVRGVDGVADAIGGVQGDAHLIGKDGKAISFGGAPNIGFSVDPSKPQFNSLTLFKGEWPEANEVIIDKDTADKKHIEVGQMLGVQSRGPVVKLRVSGIAKYGAVNSIGGATLAGFDLPTAQGLFDKVGKLDQIRVAGEPSVSGEELVRRIRAVLPAGTQVRTGEEQAKKDGEGVEEFLSFFQKFLLAFGGIALFVGSFVIANSLSITIAQRTREFATLRTLGASRRQVRLSVLIESLATGIVASLIGIAVGLGLAKGLFAMFHAIGLTLPDNGLPFRTRTLVVSLLVGIGVTVAASLRPAIRATRVPPIAAVREGAVLPPGRFARFRSVGALATITAGVALILVGLFVAHGTKGVLTAMLVGALLTFVGVSMFSQTLVRPLAGVLGWPASRVAGVGGLLARDNARRNPQRTASTASAVMIGLALVTVVATIAAGIIRPFEDAVDQLFVGDYAITAQNDFDLIPPAAAGAVAGLPEVDTVASVRSGQGGLITTTPGKKPSLKVIYVTAVEPGMSKVLALDWQEGSQATMETLGDDGAIVSKGYAKDHDLVVGSRLDLVSPSGASLAVKIKGIFVPPTGGSPFGDVTISSGAFDARWQDPRNQFSFVKTVGGVSDANTRALATGLERFPNAKAQTVEEFKDNQIKGFKQFLNVLYVLLALSVVVSLFGIVNTLVLTVYERTREIGMLRAIGLTRRQTRRMIRHESVITALIGAAIGIVLGILLGALLAVRVKEITFVIPIGQVILFAIAAIFVGILAAIFPARRAAKLDPLEALHYE
ncbi:MAG: FtsX-like permease family protein [Gaiellales bacterium]